MSNFSNADFKPEKEPRVNPGLHPQSEPGGEKATARPTGLETRFAAPPDLLSPRTAAIPAMDVETVRGIGPGGNVVVPPTGLAAAGAEQLPRAGLCDRQGVQ